MLWNWKAVRRGAYSFLCVASRGLLSFIFNFVVYLSFTIQQSPPSSEATFCDSYSKLVHISFTEVREVGAKGEGCELMNSFLVNPGILALQYPCPGGSSWAASRCCPLPRPKHRMWLLPWFLLRKGTVSNARKEENNSGVLSFSEISPYFLFFLLFLRSNWQIQL